jgi:hypothetical protein
MAGPSRVSKTGVLTERNAPARDIPRARWARFALAAAPPLVALANALAFGPYLIDDAYITFRYAANLAAGHGLVFNPGEAVLGTSTPLLAMVLGGLKFLGANIPGAARVLALLAVVGVVLLMQRLAVKPLGLVGAAAVGLCLALHPDLAFTANSGMETGLSIAAVYGALLLTLRGSYFWAGLVGGIAFLLRPDGAVVIALAIGAGLWRAPRRCWQPILGALLLCAPWLVYAQHTYGGVTPHSIAAKQLIHAKAPLEILRLNVMRLTLGTEMKVLSPLALIGLVLSAVRRSDLVLVGAWLLLYMAGLSVARIAPFPWYLSPAFPGVILLAGYAISEIAAFVLPRFRRTTGSPRARRRPAAPRPIPATAPALSRPVGAVTGLALLALAGVGHAGRAAWRGSMYDRMFGQRTPAYLAIGRFLRSRCAPGDVVFVGEVGALAYALREQVILDSSGINSPQVLRARQADHARLSAAGAAPSSEGSVAWVLAVIDEFAPRYVVTYGPWLHLRELAAIPRMLRRYRRLDMRAYPDYVILERLPAEGK